MPYWENLRTLSILLFVRKKPDFIQSISFINAQNDRILRFQFSDERNNYDLQERWGDCLWKCIERDVSFKKMITKMYLNYRYVDNIIINNFHEFEYFTYQNTLNKMISNRRLLLNDILMKKGLPIEVANIIIEKFEKCKRDEIKSLVRKNIAKYF
jgi:hypothetical protein